MPHRRLSFFWCVLLMALGLGVPVEAEQIHWLPQATPAALDQVSLRRLPGGTLLIAPDARMPLEIAGAIRMRVPPGSTAYLARPHDDAALALLRRNSTMLRRLDDDFWLLAATTAQLVILDSQPVQRERIAYLPPVLPRRTNANPAPRARVRQTVKEEIIAAVDQGRIGQFMQELSGELAFDLEGTLHITNNRWTHAAEHHIAADYIENRFESWGYTVMRQEFVVGASSTQNIVAVKTGTIDPDRILVVGGHYDSISQDPTTLAPGCEDNASGTSAVLQLAEIFADYDVESTIHFVAFGGEEQGLFGSQHYVSQASANADDVIGALTMDMIASWQTNYEVIIEGDEPWESLMSVLEGNVQGLGEIGYRKDYFSFGSDHVPFQQAGIPALLAVDMDWDSYPFYHRTGDRYAFTDPSLTRAITRAMAGTVADLTSPAPRDTSVGPPPTRPATATLEQNQPNPFNSGTKIEFSIREPGWVRLEIFDIAGRHVKTLADEMRIAGLHEEPWEGIDKDGKPVSSGVYIYRLEHEGVVLSRRMVLAK